MGARDFWPGFPRFGEFGAWDCDHLILTMFPNAGRERIMERLPQYINAQWYPGTVEEYLLRPWSDERCRDIPPIQRGFM
ncbi:MAG: hypothetical protein JWM59_4374 [Verrucomicrobiales bacterium]|nr:hypothetical protein [Verrucomicrobiales bacterium]